MAKHQQRTKTHWVTQSLALLALIIGAAIALYPFYVGALNDVLDNYRLQRNQKLNHQSVAARLAEMAEENARLKKEGLNANKDPFRGLDQKTRKKLKHDQLGSVTVPKLKLTVPLFQTLSEKSLAIGAAVVPGTSMPVGGRDTHSVIAGHRGLIDRRLFRDLNRVHRGDLFVLKVFDRHLAYRVFRIQTVLPADTDRLQIAPGRDIATLLTCTPYMINSHRLLVTGKRVPYTKAVAKEVDQAKNRERLEQLAILAATLAALGLLAWLIGRYIHGLLLRRHRFDLVVYRQDAAGQPLAQVGYVLCKPNGKPLYRGGQPLQVISDQEGKLFIADLPGGRYLLKESATKQKFAVRVATRRLRQREFRLYPRQTQRNSVIYGDDCWIIRR